MNDDATGILLAAVSAGLALLASPLAARGLTLPAALWCVGGPLLAGWSLWIAQPIERPEGLLAATSALHAGLAAMVLCALSPGLAAFWLGRGRTLLNRAGLVAPPMLAVGALSALVAMVAKSGVPFASVLPGALGLPLLAVAGALAGMRRQPGNADALAAPLTELRVGIAGAMVGFGLLSVMSLWADTEVATRFGVVGLGNGAPTGLAGATPPRWLVMMPAAPTLLFSVILAATQLVPLGEGLRPTLRLVSAGFVALMLVLGLLATVGFVLITLL